MWVTGFTDAEGSFFICIYKRGDRWVFIPKYEISLHSKDSSILHSIKGFFGVGKVNIRNTKPHTTFVVTKISDLHDVIITHFTKFPLQTQKRVDFELWSKIVVMIKNKEHLTNEGLLKILSLKSALNHGLSKTTDEI